MSLLVLGLAVTYAAVIPEQSDFEPFIAAYGLAFLCYAYLVYKSDSLSLKSILTVAIILRVILVWTFPNMSDDLYRFIWDGNMIHAGYNPYGYLPTEVLSMSIEGNTQALFDELNSQEYYTVYPPLAQFIYYCGTLGDISWHGSSIIMKLFLCAAEIGSLFCIVWLLRYLNQSVQKVAIYALNPLVIIELMGNLHFEALTVFFVLLSLCLLVILKERMATSTFLLSLGVASKMLPLMFFPFFWKYHGLKFRFIWISAVCVILLFVPILFGLELSNFGQSLDLYFGKFEFNGSIYLLLRSVGKWISGYNLIRYLGPGMALITLGLMFRWFRNLKPTDLEGLIKVSFYSITTYYFLSTTVHPWYLALPLVLSLFTHYRYVMLWTGLIMLSYINYNYAEYTEVFAVQWVEYVGVFALLGYELKKASRN